MEHGKSSSNLINSLKNRFPDWLTNRNDFQDLMMSLGETSSIDQLNIRVRRAIALIDAPSSVDKDLTPKKEVILDSNLIYARKMMNKYFRDNPLFNSLDNHYLDKLIKQFKVIEYAPEQEVFRQGDEASMIYFILCGSCRVIINGNIVAEKRQFEIFGETALQLEVETRTATIITNALQPMLCAVLHRSEFDSIVFYSSHKDVADRIRWLSSRCPFLVLALRPQVSADDSSDSENENKNQIVVGFSSLQGLWERRENGNDWSDKSKDEISMAIKNPRGLHKLMGESKGETKRQTRTFQEVCNDKIVLGWKPMLLRPLQRNALVKLACRLFVRRFSRGETIFMEGDEAQCCFFIREGSIIIEKSGKILENSKRVALSQDEQDNVGKILVPKSLNVRVRIEEVGEGALIGEEYFYPVEERKGFISRKKGESNHFSADNNNNNNLEREGDASTPLNKDEEIKLTAAQVSSNGDQLPIVIEKDEFGNWPIRGTFIPAGSQKPQTTFREVSAVVTSETCTVWVLNNDFAHYLSKVPGFIRVIRKRRQMMKRIMNEKLSTFRSELSLVMLSNKLISKELPQRYIDRKEHEVRVDILPLIESKRKESQLLGEKEEQEFKEKSNLVSSKLQLQLNESTSSDLALPPLPIDLKIDFNSTNPKSILNLSSSPKKTKPKTSVSSADEMYVGRVLDNRFEEGDCVTALSNICILHRRSPSKNLDSGGDDIGRSVRGLGKHAEMGGWLKKLISKKKYAKINDKKIDTSSFNGDESELKTSIHLPQTPNIDPISEGDLGPLLSLAKRKSVFIDVGGDFNNTLSFSSTINSAREVRSSPRNNNNSHHYLELPPHASSNFSISNSALIGIGTNSSKFGSSLEQANGQNRNISSPAASPCVPSLASKVALNIVAALNNPQRQNRRLKLSQVFYDSVVSTPKSQLSKNSSQKLKISKNGLKKKKVNNEVMLYSLNAKKSIQIVSSENNPIAPSRNSDLNPKVQTFNRSRHYQVRRRQASISNLENPSLQNTSSSKRFNVSNNEIEQDQNRTIQVLSNAEIPSSNILKSSSNGIHHSPSNDFSKTLSVIVPHLPNYKSPNLPSPGKIQRKTAPSPLKAIPSRYLAVVDVLDPLDHAIALEGFISKLKDYNTNVKSNGRNDNDDASANDYNVDPNEFPFLGCSLITVDGQRSDPLIMNDAIQGVENSKGRSPSLSTLIERTKGSSGRSGSAEDALVQVCLKQMMETQEKQRKRIEVLRLEKEVQHEVGQEGKESMIQSMQLLPHPPKSTRKNDETFGNHIRHHSKPNFKHILQSTIDVIKKSPESLPWCPSPGATEDADASREKQISGEDTHDPHQLAFRSIGLEGPDDIMSLMHTPASPPLSRFTNGVSTTRTACDQVCHPHSLHPSSRLPLSYHSFCGTSPLNAAFGSDTQPNSWIGISPSRAAKLHVLAQPHRPLLVYEQEAKSFADRMKVGDLIVGDASPSNHKIKSTGAITTDNKSDMLEALRKETVTAAGLSLIYWKKLQE